MKKDANRCPAEPYERVCNNYYYYSIHLLIRVILNHPPSLLLMNGRIAPLGSKLGNLIRTCQVLLVYDRTRIHLCQTMLLIDFIEYRYDGISLSEKVRVCTDIISTHIYHFDHVHLDSKSENGALASL